MKTLLITGGNGYIARSLYNTLKNNYDVTTITRQDFDLTNYDNTCSWFKTKTYDAVIHTAVRGGSRLIPDDQTVFQHNLKMYENLKANKDRFGRLVTFGSGAEIFAPNTFYGASKKTIADSIQETSNFFNLRVFGVFDKNELDTRFIKANIKRYIQQLPMIIHTDKVMDFFFMEDLVSLVKWYLEEKEPPKSINCSYKQKYTLSNIADTINKLNQYTVPVTIQNTDILEFYCGPSHNMPIKTIGLERGIYTVYNSLLNGDLIHA